MSIYDERINGLRRLMREKGIAAFIIPTGDPHMSEYIPESWKLRAWYSGFTGSAGTLVVTAKQAGLWTDGRYYTQAQQQLANSQITLFRASEPDCPPPAAYIKDNLNVGDTAALDGRTQSADTVKRLRKLFAQKQINLLDSDAAMNLWSDRPKENCQNIFALDESISGCGVTQKLAQLRERIAEKQADGVFLSRLDETAWLFNLRGNDIACNPVFFSYAFVDASQAVLFANIEKIDEQTKQQLQKQGVALKKYEDAHAFLAGIKKPLTVIFDPRGTNSRIMETAQNNTQLKIKECESPVMMMKAVKNPVEIKNIYEAFRIDAAAQCEFYTWLFAELEQGNTYDEYYLAQKLTAFRRERESYITDSFEPIIGYAENAAIIHYSPQQSSAKTIAKRGLLLNDSGGQYRCGTTDTTRTVALGELTDEEKHDFTLCLKAMIALSRAQFKKGTTGEQLDILARRPFWEKGMDYRHGTGHGVGFLLNVHEGPHGFGAAANKTPLEIGMVITVEPGYYKEGSHGIRIENVVHVVSDKKTEYGEFYRFDTFTVMPIDTNCIEPQMLDTTEKEWLNNYHQHVWEQVSPLVGEKAKEWLKSKTQPIK